MSEEKKYATPEEMSEFGRQCRLKAEELKAQGVDIREIEKQTGVYFASGISEEELKKFEEEENKRWKEYFERNPLPEKTAAIILNDSWIDVLTGKKEG